VNFLVGDEAFERHEDGIVTMAPGIPIGTGGIPVDHLGILPRESHLQEALRHPVIDGGLPIAPLETLIYLKLKSPRRRDEADVTELLRINDPKPVRLYLQKHAQEMLAKFDELASEAES
jgi:hypothetical protein